MQREMNFIKANFVPLVIGMAIGVWVVPIVRNRFGK